MHSGKFPPFYDSLSNKKKRYVKKTLMNADILISLSSNWEKYYFKFITSKRIHILHNAIDTNDLKNYRTKKKSAGIKKLLFVGRIERTKGIYEILEAMKELKSEKIELLIMGPFQDNEKKIRSLCKKYEIENKVKFLGMIVGKRRYMYFNEADVFILPSYYEGLPLTIIEAMAFGLPVVATKVGAIPEVIKENINGFLIEPKNSQALLNTLRSLLLSPAVLKKISKNNISQANRFYSLNTYINRIRTVYNAASNA
jgi:glycosyltransferase involved in cell wall biosynthesis